MGVRMARHCDLQQPGERRSCGRTQIAERVTNLLLVPELGVLGGGEPLALRQDANLGKGQIDTARGELAQLLDAPQPVIGGSFDRRIGGRQFGVGRGGNGAAD